MGNNNVTPVDHAKSMAENLAKKFLGKKSKTTDLPQLLADWTYRFSELLEDALVNNKTYRKLKEEEKVACVGSLLIYHAFVKDMLQNPPKDWNPLAFCEKFFEKVPTAKTLAQAVSINFWFENGQFYRWQNNLWVPCEESEVLLIDAHTKIDFDPTLETFGLTSPDVEAGRQWATVMLADLKAAVLAFNDDLSDLFEIVKDRSMLPNQEPFALPCYKGVVDFSKGALREYKRSDLFTVKLPFDPIKKITPLTQKFLETFPCEKKILASTLVRWGYRGKRTLTILTGVDNSGKNTLAEYGRALYGPFACVEGDDANFDLVRTCFVSEKEEEEDLEKFVREHPSVNLVYITNQPPECGPKFGGRRVHKLEFTESIPESDRKKNIIPRVTTRKQLAGGLGWCLTNYEPVSTSNPSDLLMQMLMRGGPSTLGSMLEGLADQSSPTRGGCGQPGCRSCSAKTKESDTTRRPDPPANKSETRPSWFRSLN